MDKAELHALFHKHVAEMMDQIFDERPDFVMLIPTHGMLVSSIEPHVAAFHLSNCVTSLISANYNPTAISEEDENGNVTAKKVDMN